VCWVSTTRESGGKTVAARLLPRNQMVERRKGLKEDFICVVTSSNLSDALVILVTIVT